MAWHSSGSSNDELVDNLVENGLIPSEGIASAFRSVDRIYFVPEGCADLAYEDRPLKEGNVHISAPHIYCTVVKHLEIKPDSSQSFLNIGVGTGYLSALVSIILGPKSQLYGVDIHSAVIDHCREATRVWKESIDEEVAKCFLFHGNGLSILPEGESRLGFDRIYVGAAIDSSDLPKLQCLLAPGGILVAPVDDRLTQADRILHMMEQDNEDEDNGMDVEDEDDEAPNLGLGLDQSMESDDDMLHDRSSRIEFRSVSITNEDL
eukprot:scaffold1872_cov268-Chaetoceros_neogracile.AAC.27